MKLTTVAMTGILSAALSASNAQTQRIVFFGASTLAYRGALDIASFRVGRMLDKQGHHAIIFNSGRPGATTKIALKRFKIDVLDLYPDLTIFLLGTNDSMIDTHRGATQPRVSPEEYEKNLRYMISALKKRKCAVVLMTLQPLYMTEKLKIYNHEPYCSKGFNFMVDKYNEIIRKTAKNEYVPCVDLNKIFWQAADGKYENLPKLFSDGMHPNNTGQKLIADQIMKTFENNPQLLTNRSEFAKKVKCLKLFEPRPGSKFEKKFRVCVTAVPGTAKLQYRFKAHYGKNRKKNFGDWLDLEFTRNDNMLNSVISGLVTRKYSLQFRELDNNGNILGVGAVDHITVK